jgi:hypothetical protein
LVSINLVQFSKYTIIRINGRRRDFINQQKQKQLTQTGYQIQKKNVNAEISVFIQIQTKMKIRVQHRKWPTDVQNVIARLCDENSERSTSEIMGQN